MVHPDMPHAPQQSLNILVGFVRGHLISTINAKFAATCKKPVHLHFAKGW